MAADGLQVRLGSWAGRRVLEALLGTVRFERQGLEYIARPRTPEGPVIYALWHGRLLPLTYLHRGEGVATLISRSGDGEYIARIAEKWGYLTARGSSTRGGGRALRELVRWLRQGHDLAITPDGPRGPRETLKPGVLLAAQVSGRPIIPVSAGTDRAWWFEAWDRFMVPKPFARLRVAYGPPITVPRDADDAALERIGTAVAAEIRRLTTLVDRRG